MQVWHVWLILSLPVHSILKRCSLWYHEIFAFCSAWCQRHHLLRNRKKEDDYFFNIHTLSVLSPKKWMVLTLSAWRNWRQNRLSHPVGKTSMLIWPPMANSRPDAGNSFFRASTKFWRMLCFWKFKIPRKIYRHFTIKKHSIIKHQRRICV